MFASGCYQGIDADVFYGDEGIIGDTGTSGDESDDFGGDGDPTTTTTTTGDPTTTTSGDGDPTTGGDGDGDPTTTTSGDGDGDPTTTTSGDGDGDPTTGGNGEPAPMPNLPYCTPVSNWGADWVMLELEVVDLVNAARAQGGNCGTEGNFPPSGPLTWQANLTCAARVHSKDMADNNYFSHTNQQGNGPGWRLDQAGYNGGAWGENIAAGYGSAGQVVQGWLDSDGHCANMLNPNFSLIGVGYAFGNGQYGHYWTQTFGN